MHHQRGAAVPAADEIQKIGDVLLCRHDIAIERRADVVQPQPEVIFRLDGARSLDARLVADQRDNMAGAGVFDRFVQPCERTDVNHGTTWIAIKRRLVKLI